MRFSSAPFDASLLVLVCMIALIFMNWSENFGDSQAQLKQSFVTAWTAIKTGKSEKLFFLNCDNFVNCISSDKRVLLLGLAQSLFEGSMYVFVLEWTPALTIDTGASKNDASNPPIPHGFIFACFMVKKYSA